MNESEPDINAESRPEQGRQPWVKPELSAIPMKEAMAAGKSLDPGHPLARAVYS